MVIAQRKCLTCGNLFAPVRSRHYYCQEVCQRSAAGHRWYMRYRKRILAKNKKYREQNKERRQVYYKEWSKRNKARIAAAKEKLRKV